MSFQLKQFVLIKKETISKGKRILTEKITKKEGSKIAFLTNICMHVLFQYLRQCPTINSKLTLLETPKPLKQSNADFSSTNNNDNNNNYYYYYYCYYYYHYFVSMPGCCLSFCKSFL